MADPLDPTLKEAAGFRHWTPVLLRFRDLDLLGHVNNVNLAGWLEDARVALELPIQPCTADYRGPVIVLVESRIQYLAEIHFGSAVRVGTRVQRIGRTSVVLGQAVFVGDTCAAIAEFVEVLIDPVTRKPAPFPAEFQALFQSHTTPPA